MKRETMQKLIKDMKSDIDFDSKITDFTTGKIHVNPETRTKTRFTGKTLEENKLSNYLMIKEETKRLNKLIDESKKSI